MGRYRVCRIFGIDIFIHWTLIISFVLFVWIFKEGQIVRAVPNQPQHLYLLSSVFITAMLFISVLVHELAHSIMAKKFGVPVRSITLFVFGGAAELGKSLETAKEEFLVALAGPAASLVTAGLFFAAAGIGSAFPQLVLASLSLLAVINVMLAIFNLIPAFPLDGGRILKSIIWGLSGNEVKAVRISAFFGKIFSVLIIALGVVGALAGDIVSGLWLVFIGWFLFSAVDHEGR